jgi:hypothetical protein
MLSTNADALACSPSPSKYLVPTGLLTDMSRPVARDAGIYFSTEARSMFVPDPAFAVEVKDTSMPRDYWTLHIVWLDPCDLDDLA